jgi:hypothetical protein
MCVGCLPSAGNPKAILAGSWRLSTDSGDDVYDTELAFDVFGELQSITVVFWGKPFTFDDLSAETAVNGDSVTVDARFMGNSLAFEGTLDEVGDEISGELTLEYKFPEKPIELQNRPATLKRVADAESWL